MSTPPWGFPWHGVLVSARYEPRLLVGGAAGPNMALGAPPFPVALAAKIGTDLGDMVNVHLVRVPGVPAVSQTLEEVGADRALGRTWQNYALAHTASDGHAMELHGRLTASGYTDVAGWVCTDAAGKRWLIKPTTLPTVLDSTLPLSFTLGVVPFGHLGQAPAAPVNLAVSLDDLGQAGDELTGDPLLKLRFASIASHGRDVILALIPSSTPAYFPQNPCGWLRLRLTGTGPAFAVTLEVLHSRGATLGSKIQTETGAMQLRYMRTHSTYETSMDETTRVVQGTPAGIAPQATTGSGAFSLGTKSHEAKILGRIINVVFDDLDQVSTITADLEWLFSVSTATPTALKLTGGSYARFPQGENLTSVGVTLTHQLSWTGTSSETNRAIIRRNGEEVDRAEHVENASFAWQDIERTVDATRSGTFSPLVLNDGIDLSGPYSVDWNVTVSYSVGGRVQHSASAVRPDWLPTKLPPAWATNQAPGVALSVDTIGTLGKVGYRADRHANQMAMAAHSLTKTDNSLLRSTTHKVIAPKAIWENLATVSDEYTPVAAYNPATHEIYVDPLGRNCTYI